jgi:RNA polymerase sigma factor (sigma-70 family)
MIDEQQKQLIDKILRGDAEAFRTFVDAYKRLVFLLVCRLIHNEADREDICQDVFISAYQSLKDFRHQSKVSTWLARITYYRCLNFLKKKQVPLFDDQTPETFTFDDVSSSFFDPYEETEKSDRAVLVRSSIEQMPLVFQTILTLYHLQELSYGEIGQVMELPEGTVKSYLFRARKMLRERLTAQIEEEKVW